MNIEIRKFRIDDLNEVLKIERLCFSEPWSPNMFQALFQICPEGFYVVILDDEIVGFGIVLIEEDFSKLFRKKKAHMMNLAVHPNFQRKGIGRAFIDAIIKDLIKMGVREIFLEVRASNTNAIAFYENSGFINKGIIKDFYKDEDAKVMDRKL